MQIPTMLQGESLKRLCQGAAIGALATIAVGFSWFGTGFGWVLGGTAKTMQSTAAEKATITALVPSCTRLFAADTAAMDKFKADKSPYSRERIVRDTVLTIDGQPLSSGLIDACAAAVTEALNKTAAKS